MRPVDEHIRMRLNHLLDTLGTQLSADIVAVVSPILPGLERLLRNAIGNLGNDQQSVAIILDTEGGVVEIVERPCRQRSGSRLTILKKFHSYTIALGSTSAF